MNAIDWIITPRSVIFVNMEGLPVTILSSDSRYKQAVKLINEGRPQEAMELSDKAKAIDVRSEGKFTVQDGVINIDGTPLPKALSDKLLKLVEAGEPTDYLERFWDNLHQNPTKESREDLFAFLEANNVPLTRDGCFIVYKKVRDDWYDSYTGNTYLNTVGKTIEVDRSCVDPDRNNTCSRGLHVAAFEYASNFSGSRLLECKVNPRDVVAVPPDYSQQKMRVCRYQILRETTTKFVEDVYNNEVENKVPGLTTEDYVLLVSRDSERRIRIPGHMIRKLKVGVGRRISAYADGGKSPTLQLFRGRKEDTPDAAYIAHTDNSVRISNKVLDEAGMVGENFTVHEMVDGDLKWLEIREAE